MSEKTQKHPSLTRLLALLFCIGGAISLVASFILTVDKIHLLKNPDYQPLCSINPVLSCVSVAGTPQAEVFGFPNMLLGVAGFSALVAVGVMMIAGAQFKRWFWIMLLVGVTLGFAFVHWLFFQSVYRIGALCIYCMLVWAAMAPIFWYTWLHCLREKIISLPAHWSWADFVHRYHGEILTGWYLMITGLIIHHFWYYFGTLL